MGKETKINWKELCIYYVLIGFIFASILFSYLIGHTDGVVSGVGLCKVFEEYEHKQLEDAGLINYPEGHAVEVTVRDLGEVKT